MSQAARRGGPHEVTREISPSRAEAMVKVLTNESDRTIFIKQVMDLGPSGGGDPALTAFQALDTEESRVQTLVEIVKSARPQVWENPDYRAHDTNRMESLTQKLGISDQGRQQWRAALPP